MMGSTPLDHVLIYCLSIVRHLYDEFDDNDDSYDSDNAAIASNLCQCRNTSIDASISLILQRPQIRHKLLDG